MVEFVSTAVYGMSATKALRKMKNSLIFYLFRLFSSLTQCPGRAVRNDYFAVKFYTGSEKIVMKG
jgi:hypothetical protein